MNTTTPAGRPPSYTRNRGGRRRAALALAPDPSEQRSIAAECDARARAALAAADAAGEPLVTPAGRRRSPITLPEYRQGRAPANKGKRYPTEILTPDELQALLDVFPPRSPFGSRSRALVVVLWRAGLRIAEALALVPDDVDLEHGAITILAGKGAKRRTIGIDAVALEYLREWITDRAMLGVDARAPLFCTCCRDAAGPGRPLSSSVFREQLKRYARAAGISKRVHPHGLRHTHAFELAMEGVPVNLIRGQLGHVSLEMTQHYIDHLAPVALLNALRQREWPGGVAAPATTRAAASELQHVPVGRHVVPSVAPTLPRDLPEPERQDGAVSGVLGATKARILELVIANGGRATQAQLCRALRLRNTAVRRHCDHLTASGQLVCQRVAHPAGIGGPPRIVWVLPPLRAIFTDARSEVTTRARNGQGPGRVLETVRALGGRASQAQIGGVLGLTPGTVAKHCQELERRGELELGGLDKSTSNRGSQIWRLPSGALYTRDRPLLTLTIAATSTSTRRSPNAREETLKEAAS